MRVRAGLLLYIGIVLAACRSRTLVVETSNSPLPFMSPQEVVSDLVTEAPDFQVPPPSPGLGVVHGRLVTASPAGRAFLAGDIYLASLREMEGSAALTFIRLAPDEDPKASLRNEGNEFAILDVEPGQYALVIHTPVSDYVVPDNAGGYLVVEVEEGEIVDLGAIRVE